MKTSSHLVIESLESKLAPAGTVAAVLSGGVLTLTGTLDDNSLTITEFAPDQFTIAGAGGTLIKLGADAPAASVNFSALVHTIKADLKEGNDTLNLNNIDLGKDLVVNQGIGNNATNLSGLFVGGNVTILGGANADNVTLAAFLEVGGNVTLNLGDGVNNFSSNISHLLVQGGLSYTGGNSADNISLSNGFINLGSLTVAAGSGDGTLSIGASDFLIGGAVNITTLDHASVSFNTILNAGDRLVIGGPLTVKNGLGNNGFTLTAGDSALIEGAISITNGVASNSSSVSITSTLLSVEGGITIKNGNGAFNNFIAGGQVDIHGGISITNGNSVGTTSNGIAGNVFRLLGGISISNGSGTFNNNINPSLLNAGGAISITNVDSNAGLTTNSISIPGMLNATGVTIKNGDGQFRNEVISGQGGRVAGNISITTDDATGVVTNQIAAPLVTGNIIIDNGDGDFSNSITGNATLVGGSISISNGTSVATTSNSFNTGLLEVKGGLTIKNLGGTVSNNFGTTDINIKGGLSITNGNGGANTTNTAFNASNSIRIGGGFSIVNGNGIYSQSINAGSVFVGGAFSVNSGSQSTGTTSLNLNISSTLSVGGGLTVKSLGGTTATTINANHINIAGVVAATSASQNDTFVVQGGSSLVLGGATLSFGDGDSTANLITNGVANIKGGVSFSALSGADTWRISGAGRIGGAVSANMGAGSAGTLEILNNSGLRSLDIAGAASINVSGVTGPVTHTIRGTVFQGAYGYTGAAGADSFYVQSSVFRGNAAVNTGAGGDSIFLDDVTAFGTVSILTGAGNDFVFIETGAGLAGRSVFHKAVTIATGADVDSIAIANSDAARTAEFKVASTVDGGADADTYTPGANLIGTVTAVNI